jgi:hypothetical protein
MPSVSTPSSLFGTFARNALRVLLVAALCGIGWGAAPRPAAAQVSLDTGVRAGVSASSFRGSDIDDLTQAGDFVDIALDRRTGFTVGVFASFSVLDLLAVQPEVFYVQRGAAVNLTAGTSSTDFLQSTGTVEADYLQIPVLAKLRVPVGGPVTPFVALGPAVTVKLSETSAASIAGTEFFRGEILQDRDFSAIVAGGVDLPTAFGTVLLDVRYDFGLTSVFETDGGESSDIFNGALTVTAGVTL